MPGREYPKLKKASDWYRQRTITAASYTVDPANDDTILADATGAPITINLPPAAQCFDAVTGTAPVFTVVRMNGAANAVTIDPNGAEQINGAATASLAAQFNRIAFMSNGTAWVNV